MEKKKLIIIGAGAAGLMAAGMLADEFAVAVLEAQATAGGRIRTQRLNCWPAETGAEFIHGELPVTLGLVKDAGLTPIVVEGNMLRNKGGRFTEEDEMTPHWERLMKEMRRLKTDLTLEQFLSEHFAGAEHDNFRREVTGYAEGFDLADVSKVSTQSLYKEWQKEDEDNFRIQEGYSALTDYLQEKAAEKGATFLFNTVVKKIVWAQDHVAVFDDAGKNYQADKMIITVPLSVLAGDSPSAAIEFFPAIPAQEKAAAEIGYGAVIKIIFEFTETFWPRDAGFIITDGIIRTWWTQLPDAVPVLTGWVGGPPAEQLSSRIDEDLRDLALQSLADLFHRDPADLATQLKGWIVCNPQANAFSAGAYSYDYVDSAAAKELLRTPVANTIYFAGEGFYDGAHPGTVEAALVSGADAARLVRDQQ